MRGGTCGDDMCLREAALHRNPIRSNCLLSRKTSSLLIGVVEDSHYSIAVPSHRFFSPLSGTVDLLV